MTPLRVAWTRALAGGGVDLVAWLGRIVAGTAVYARGGTLERELDPTATHAVASWPQETRVRARSRRASSRGVGA